MSPWTVLGWMLVAVLGVVFSVILLLIVGGLFVAVRDELRLRRRRRDVDKS